jgi:class 3 adenylate cyclase
MSISNRRQLIRSISRRLRAVASPDERRAALDLLVKWHGASGGAISAYKGGMASDLELACNLNLTVTPPLYHVIASAARSGRYQEYPGGIAWPLGDESGAVVGVIALYDDTQNKDRSDTIELLQTLAPTIAASLKQTNHANESADEPSSFAPTAIYHDRHSRSPRARSQQSVLQFKDAQIRSLILKNMVLHKLLDAKEKQVSDLYPLIVRDILAKQTRVLPQPLYGHVIYADGANFSTRDPATRARILRKFRSVVDGIAGNSKPVKMEQNGDAVMMIFSEGSLRTGISAAFALIRAMASSSAEDSEQVSSLEHSIQIRVGLASGSINFESEPSRVGVEPESGGDDVIIRAVRLEAVAEPGKILADESTVADSEFQNSAFQREFCAVDLPKNGGKVPAYYIEHRPTKRQISG